MIYGAKPDARGPIGGGEGYTKRVTGGDYTVQDLEGLIDALAKAKLAMNRIAHKLPIRTRFAKRRARL